MMHSPSPDGTAAKMAWLEWDRSVAPASLSESDASRADEGLECRAIASRIIVRSSCSEISIDVHLINDPDNGGVHRRAFPAERLACCAALENDQHLLVDSRTDTVHRQHDVAARRVVQVQRL